MSFHIMRQLEKKEQLYCPDKQRIIYERADVHPVQRFYGLKAFEIGLTKRHFALAYVSWDHARATDVLITFLEESLRDKDLVFPGNGLGEAFILLSDVDDDETDKILAHVHVQLIRQMEKLSAEDMKLLWSLSMGTVIVDDHTVNFHEALRAAVDLNHLADEHRQLYAIEHVSSLVEL